MSLKGLADDRKEPVGVLLEVAAATEVRELQRSLATMRWRLCIVHVRSHGGAPVRATN
jgi:hypothetical protein